MENLIRYLKDYLKECGADALVKLCEFVGTSPRAVTSWISGPNEPKGLNLVKLRYFLEFQGYKIEEFAKMSETVYNLGLLISHGCFNFQKIADLLAYRGGATDELLRVLRGNRNLSGEKAKLVELLLLENEIPLRELKSQKMPLKEVSETAQKSDARVQKIERVERRSISNTEIQEDIILLQNMENISKMLAPRLKNLLTNGTPEMRRRLRETIGAKQVFNLSNNIFRIHETVSMLCSEKSMAINKDNEGGK